MIVLLTLSILQKPFFTHSPAIVIVIANGTSSHRSLFLPLRLNRLRSTNPIPLRRRQPHPERNRSTPRQGSAMHRRRQRSLHWYDGEVLLRSAWVQSPSRKTSSALPGLLTDSLVEIQIRVGFELNVWKIVMIWWEWGMNCCCCCRLGLRRKKWRFRGVWWMKKCRRKSRKCRENISLILRLVLISNGDISGESVLVLLLHDFRSFSLFFFLFFCNFFFLYS